MHDHSHEISIPKTAYGKVFAIGIGLNLFFVIAEVIYGLMAHSLALIADAGHNFSDVIGLVLAWIAMWLAARKPTAQYTYGLKSTTILSALANAILLLTAVGAIAWEAIWRFQTPSEVNSLTVIAVAGIGIAVNAITAYLFMKGRHSDLNIRGAYLHMAADALVSVGVVISGLIMLKTHWMWIDPAVSILVCIVITVGTYGLLKDSFKLAVQAVPQGIEAEKIHHFLASQKDVVKVHDLHIWGMSTTENALTAHLIMPNGNSGDAFLNELTDELKNHFNVHHVTLQIEKDDCEKTC